MDPGSVDKTGHRKNMNQKNKENGGPLSTQKIRRTSLIEFKNFIINPTVTICNLEVRNDCVICAQYNVIVHF